MAYRVHKLQYPHRLVHMATGGAIGYGEQVFVQVWGRNLAAGRVLDSQGNMYIRVIETDEWAFHVGSLRHALAANDSITFESKLPEKTLADEQTPDFDSVPEDERPLVEVMAFSTGLFTPEAYETLYQIERPGLGKDEAEEATADVANAGC